MDADRPDIREVPAIPLADDSKSDAATMPRSPLPDVGDLIVVGLMCLLIFLAPNMLFSDGSTGWHIATGQYIIDNFSVPHKDLISYTFADKPWVPYEWLWDALAAGLERLGGLNLLAVACATAIAVLFGLLYGDERKHGLHFVAALVLTLIGSLVSSIHWLARPHLVTFFGVYIFSRTLDSFARGNCPAKKLWLILGITMVVWVNCHPAFLLGFVITGIYLVSDILLAIFGSTGGNPGSAPGSAGFQPASEGENSTNAGKMPALPEVANAGEPPALPARTIQLLIALGIIAAATLINPNGLQLFSYISHYLHQTSILEVTDEFQSPIFHGAMYTTGLEILFLLLAFGLATSSKRPALGQFLLVLAFAHLALSAKRNAPLFVIVALPLIAEQLANSTFARWLAEKNEPGTISKFQSWLKQRWQSSGETVDEMESSCNMHLLPIIAVALCALSCIGQARIQGMPAIVDCGFNPKDKPTKTLTYISQKKLDPKHGFNLDNWGGYIRYKTGNRVFIDDRSDFYGQEFFQQYGQVAEVHPGWDKRLDDNHIDWVLFPKDSTLRQALIEQEKDGTGKFSKAAEDDGSTLFVRTKQ